MKKNLCMITTIYSLLLWLLYASEKEIKETYYIFEFWIPKSITSHFEHRFILPQFDRWYMRDKRTKWLWLRYLKWRYLPNFKKYNLIAHDHLFYSPIFIGKQNYTMLEDGPRIFSEKSVANWAERCKKHLYKKHWLKKMLNGPTAGLPMGTNKQCTDLIVTSMDIAPQLKDKKIHCIDLFNAWTLASEKKKRFILDVFGISDMLIQQIENRDIVYFSGGHCDNGDLTEDEYRDFYKKLLKKYDLGRLVIKPHPRDYCEFYEKDLPGVIVLPSFVPSQLMDMIGLHFKKAITIDSSAVYNMSYPIEIDWYGRQSCPKLLEKYGAEILPKSDHVNYCTL